ncbi:hypothetical protein Q765_00220 [Flavobacterium rivuli WB 3.3-2 = DSM 21788]|uniref:Uncharacterized protein n=1 Tax=Flavobacterium rivuli WB 3.3-2 = DSM 21788 TaxID=1121895 RepID=A0A0A2MJ72_9FLAO|nr:hypothetical protein [Flavobacterium rivuli]KGO88380.1 hypothetical protein Q765_00220 [Flavobacterium rivuli WB 3.3-2 = DSM 21788]
MQATKPTPPTVDQVTPEVIAAWKAQHGRVYKIPLETGEVCFVRSPKIKEIEAAQPNLQAGKFITYNIFLFNTCFLGGDDVKDDEAKLMAAAGMMMETVETITATLEKL